MGTKLSHPTRPALGVILGVSSQVRSYCPNPKEKTCKHTQVQTQAHPRMYTHTHNCTQASTPTKTQTDSEPPTLNPRVPTAFWIKSQLLSTMGLAYNDSVTPGWAHSILTLCLYTRKCPPLTSSLVELTPEAPDHLQPTAGLEALPLGSQGPSLCTRMFGLLTAAPPQPAVPHRQ